MPYVQHNTHFVSSADPSNRVSSNLSSSDLRFGDVGRERDFDYRSLETSELETMLDKIMSQSRSEPAIPALIPPEGFKAFFSRLLICS
jgi:hypothetical protein